MDEQITIEDRMRAALPDLTRAERQLATHVLKNYPVPGNEALGGYEHANDPVRANALHRARQTSLPAVSDTRPHTGRDTGVAIYAPVLTRDGVSGFAAAEFAYSEFFAKLDRRLRTAVDVEAELVRHHAPLGSCSPVPALNPSGAPGPKPTPPVMSMLGPPSSPGARP